ncbi:hypothetical protein MNEG_13381 [Monoraphidium neglectum]|uniref:Uncharacterized protein n=1 Tax=Monoraphidium neglectum TaxID=145388 RepID=A0A0D2J3U1_9CHLO|nr:hypothetical protein MNEG_13381 [Monoraphidium neglectum]KIY94582.1 hypothetical protein MNEG_13381 [Monoraphidium neglectum]|eukprot:XP_013893602.1 hypothetical protein MNEG_13381 [Monoraphidium neglectum]
MGDLIRTAAEGGGSRAAAAFARLSEQVASPAAASELCGVPGALGAICAAADAGGRAGAAAAAFARLSEQVASPAAASELCGVPGALGAICAAADAGGRAGAAALLLLARVASCGDADVAQALATHPAGCLPTLVDAGRGGGACGAAARRALLDILMADLSLSLAVRSTRGAVEAIADAIARDCCDSAVGLLFTITSGARSDLLRRLARTPGCLDALFFRIEPGGYEALSPLSALWQMVDSDVRRNGALLRDAPGSLEAIAAAAARGIVAWGLAFVLLAALPCASEAERAALAQRAGRVDGFVAAALRRMRRGDEAGAAAAAVLLTMARGDASFAALICDTAGSTCDICAAAVGGGERGGAAIKLLSTLCASCPDLEVSLARAMLEADGFMTALVRAVRAGDAHMRSWRST